MTKTAPGNTRDAAIAETVFVTFIHGKRVASPNDLKLSDCPARRDGCAGEGGGAAGVTRGAVRSSLGV